MWTRANALFFYSLTVLFVMAVGSFVTTLRLSPRPVVRQLELRQLKTLRPQRESLQRGEMTDRAILTFDLDCDLRDVFNWNVKQLFVYVTAQYRTPTNGFNEIVIWDRVVNRTADARIRLVDAFNKYPVIDQRTELRGTPITLALNWDVMPITGLLYKQRRGASTVRMPPAYCTEAECKPELLALAEVERRPAAAAGSGGAPLAASASSASWSTSAGRADL